MKKKFFLLILPASVITYSQVGINTSTPQKSLHVNGSLQVVNEINVGGTANTAGSAGITGQVLTSKGTGVAPSWSTLEDTGVVKLSTLALKNSTYSGNYAAYNWFTVVWETAPKLDNTKLTYNSSNGVFTIVKSGYYQILASTHINMSLNGVNETSGTAHTSIKKNTSTIANVNSGHLERTDNVYHTIAGASYFNSGDTLYVEVTMTRNYRIAGGDSFISITYLGQ
ncbi:hypothetical protein [Chryseobacterium rhizosphaerae]|uniref:C1q domain-containing protein n=1 Tax=Chryseobacterium rhizosphaerae TaxID=395937 RepID=A0ABX9IEG2_9FLAO|nr:hypothetical protein [Chryseobacterium rhizosphaerae]REC69230.1 hypothetical protein DRF57_23150 [Chryseobacterium rhizosphaerae]GEN69624.1 hypothetical protein CRH01_41920 [Chryseobacterium rhizosphaerae]